MKRDILEILKHYLIAVLWTENLDNYEVANVSAESTQQATKDITEFVNKAGDLLTPEWTDEQIGHDFWLTRNGHGAGFWDRDLPNANELTKVCKEFKPVNQVFVNKKQIIIE